MLDISLGMEPNSTGHALCSVFSSSNFDPGWGGVCVVWADSAWS